MDIKDLSKIYHVRRLAEADIDIIVEMCSKNENFYKFHPPFVTPESILQDMNSLPPGKTHDDLYYIGFFENDVLVAVMDLVLGYPDNKTAYIGFFMMNVQYQNKGIGTRIIEDCKEYLKKINYNKIRLGVDKGNKQSFNFWTKNEFKQIGENEYIIMESEMFKAKKHGLKGIGGQ